MTVLSKEPVTVAEELRMTEVREIHHLLLRQLRDRFGKYQCPSSTSADFCWSLVLKDVTSAATFSCCAEVSWGYMGRGTISAAALSVIGESPAL